MVLQPQFRSVSCGARASYMKTNSTHQHVTRMIFLVVFALVVAGIFCWSLLIPRPTSTPPPTPPAFSSPRGVSATSIRLLPVLHGFPRVPIGPVEGAADATARAVILANGAALRDYGFEPFADAKASAIFDGRSWSWRKRIGYGRGDLEAEVSLSPSGTVESVTVRYLVQEFAERF